MLKKKNAVPKVAPHKEEDFELRLDYWHEEVVEVHIEMLKPYPDHPFKTLPPEKLEALAESIRVNGLQQPIILRDLEDSEEAQWEYTILSGHNRVEAMRTLGMDHVPAIIRTMDDDTAALTVVQTNLDQREGLLPSEKARAYKLMMEAYKNRTQANDTNGSADPSTGWTGESSMAYYYIRLTELISELLELVDAERIPVKGGVELSYIDQSVQQEIWQYVERSGKRLSVKDAEKLRKIYGSGKTITKSTIPNILAKQSRKAKNFTLSGRLLKRYAIPKDVDLTEIFCAFLEERFGRV